MDSGYFDEDSIKTIESLDCKYIIKAKVYETLYSIVTEESVIFTQGEDGKETTSFSGKLDSWEKDRRFNYDAYL